MSPEEIKKGNLITELELVPIIDISDSLVVKKEDGSTVHFKSAEEAKEFMMCWFGMDESAIKAYWEGTF